MEYRRPGPDLAAGRGAAVTTRGATLALILTAGLATGGVVAADLRPFVAGSADQIRQAHAGQAYVLALWSVNCTHCTTELALLGELRRRHPGLPLVLVATDTPEDHAALAATLRRYGLAPAETWVFADPFTERLRFEIDRRWLGELPRSYLVSRDGTAQTVSGRLERARLERWLADQHRSP
jgi:hypothetical protein